MSFRCQQCNNACEGSPILRVTERRERDYKFGEGRMSRGHEIVKEKRICSICAVDTKDAPIPVGVFEFEAVT